MATFKKGFLGIDLKKDADAILLGFGVALLAAILPIPGDPMGALISKIRAMFAPRA